MNNEPGEVRQIRVAPTGPDPKVLECVEELLRLAQSGELRGVALIGYLTDSEIKYGFYGAEMTGNRLRTHGLLTWLANKALSLWEAGFEEVTKS